MQHDKAKFIFDQAFGISDANERRAYVQSACGGDQELLEQVESLLQALGRCGYFLEVPASQRAQWAGAELPSKSFGDYDILEEIARGGMGIVYRARQKKLNRTVALKMILAGQFASEAEVKRLKSEAQSAGGLNHPNIVSIYEVGEHQGRHYYTMPLVEGENLDQLVRRGDLKPGDGREAARLIAKISRAVHYAHEAGILHRDLKPGNIMLTADGEPRITDFGLAKQVKGDVRLTVTGHLLGTPGFMAPELARGGGKSSPVSDIYSIGAILYFLLTLQAPFVADSPMDTLLLALESEAVQPRRINPHVSGILERICLRCLEKRPEDRYQSAGELAEDLEHYLKGEALTVRQQALGRRFESWVRHKPALAARLVAVLLCLVIVVTAYQVRPYTTRDRHLAVILVLVFWLIISYLCQRGLESERFKDWIRLVWSAVEPVTLTTILFIAQAFPSPLLALFPTLIAVSGFWLRVPLVAMTTATSVCGYLALLVAASHQGISKTPFHWHLLAAVGMLVTGFSVVYLVNRVGALTRFYEDRPKTNQGVGGNG